MQLATKSPDTNHYLCSNSSGNFGPYLREGITRKDDLLPRRITEEPLPEGLAKGRVITRNMYDEMLNEYYELRGWDEDGVPEKETLSALGIIP